MKEEHTKPVVSVVMSSYNGEKYIADQIESIFNQRGVDIKLIVRDDGSNDSTREIIRKYLDKGRLTLIEGQNVGYERSFMKALFACSESDFYAFADQDDVWFEDKIRKTIAAMKEDDEPQLGFCNSYFTDENLSIINNGYPDDYELPAKEMVFNSVVASGYLVVMNNSLVKLLRRAGENIPIGHDVWVGAVATYFGNITYLKERLVYHRRLKDSISRLSKTKLLKNRTKALLTDMGKNIPCAELMLGTYADILSKEEMRYLVTLRDYRKNLKDKLELLRNDRIYYSAQYGRLTPKIKIILNKF